MKIWILAGCVIGVAVMAFCLILYFLFATAPHCTKWQTVGLATPAYIEYTWNPWEQHMVQKNHPEQTYQYWGYCEAGS